MGDILSKRENVSKTREMCYIGFLGLPNKVPQLGVLREIYSPIVVKTRSLKSRCQ